jgi:hypothetical protein
MSNGAIQIQKGLAKEERLKQAFKNIEVRYGM